MNFRIIRSSIVLVNLIYYLVPCQAISLKLVAQSGQECRIKNHQFKITTV